MIRAKRPNRRSQEQQPASTDWNRGGKGTTSVVLMKWKGIGFSL